MHAFFLDGVILDCSGVTAPKSNVNWSYFLHLVNSDTKNKNKKIIIIKDFYCVL